MSRGRRWFLRVLALLLVLGAVGYLMVWRPVADAAAFLTRLEGSDPDAAALAAEGVHTWPATDESSGAPAVPRCLVVDGKTAEAPLLILVAGVTRQSIDDARVGRLALACRAAGFAVVAPDLVRLARPGEGPDPVAAVRATLWAVGRPGAGRWDAARCGVVGVSLGGGVALRAVASIPRGSGTHPVAGVLLVGAPDDARALAPEWFRFAVGSDANDRSVAARSEAGIFARHSLLRAALPALVPQADLDTLRTWIDTLGETPARRMPFPSGVTNSASVRWVTVARAESDAKQDDVVWVLDAAEPALGLVSPAAWDAELADLRTPVFLLHGQTDPLVPVTEMGLLDRRLAGRTTVAQLESRLIVHVSMEAPGAAQTWKHLRFLTRFFDVVRSAP